MMMIFRCMFLFLLMIVSCVRAEVYENVIVTSIPKCGTNLIIKCINEITKKGYYTNANNFLILDPYGYTGTVYDEFCVTHAIASQENIAIVENKGFRGIFIYRDPRDQIVSLAYYIKNLNSEWPNLTDLTIDHLIEELIVNIPIIKNTNLWSMDELNMFKGIDTFYYSYLDWLHHPLIYSTTFEKLVGVRGGGSQEEQLKEINNIANHLGYTLSYQELLQISDSLFGNSSTFRNGRVGSWKSHFSEKQKQLFKQVAGGLLIELGYENDYNW